MFESFQGINWTLELGLSHLVGEITSIEFALGSL